MSRPQRRGSHRPRAKQPRGASRVGERFEAIVGPVAHGGHCVVRLDPPEARVVFVRHALPGERVVLEITEGTDGDRFWRGDAVEVLEASADRVTAPCVFAGPDRCGGCDFQHVALPAQRALKTAIVREQLSRLAGLTWAGEVEAVPGDVDGLRWRTRHHFVHTSSGLGMRKHRSREVVLVDDCLIARTDAREPAPGIVVETVEPHEFQVAGDGFWQVHPGAPRILVDTVLGMLAPQPGETALDLYAGVGLFSRFLLDAVGERGRVVAIEGDRTASDLSGRNCPGITARAGSVDEVLATSFDQPFDLVVLDPPREGARRAVVEQVVDRAPRAVAYVACDPAALARDLATFATLGYELQELRGFDLFPMTHHVECVALLTRRG
ncbi:class I SAM-dependent RNA methyltransferase [Nocardioides sp. URHA0020]|uniref:class I SAM-dependent RNA methyltransferase n=1 Tax=Nocardioides sp. URHA0020 TaxID=1380392 RepID=UPI00048D083B|nr:TRAM domain-containing protein [Nocardioides sp. URHA0020]